MGSLLVLRSREDMNLTPFKSSPAVEEAAGTPSRHATTLSLSGGRGCRVSLPCVESAGIVPPPARVLVRRMPVKVVLAVPPNAPAAL